jgi:hypothetical protein
MSMSQALVAVLALLAALLGGGLGFWWARRPKKRAPAPLPNEWNLSPRPVFSTDERRIYRLLREALPHHIVLSKLPLVRFCQPTDPQEVRYWYDLLGATHVTFAICSANGRVLAAIDLENDRSNSRRAIQIKQSVLGACRVRYLRCPVDQPPSVAEIQLLVPHAVSSSRGPQPAPSVSQAGHQLAHTVAERRRERTALWQDSGFFQDSFFMPDPRREQASVFGSLDGGSGQGASRYDSRLDSSLDGPPTEPGGGVVIDTPGFSQPVSAGR